MRNETPDRMSARIRDGRRVVRELSVVVGCYNAGTQLEQRVGELLSFLDGLGRNYELLVVEDGSVDDSLPILRRLERTVPQLTILRNPRNMGKGFSIRNGVLNSSGKLIIFTDVDMAYAKDNLVAVLDQLEAGAPVVVGNRRLPESRYTVNNTLVKYVHRRHRNGVAFNTLVRFLFGLTARDTQSGLKGFSREAALPIFERLYTDGFLFDVEIFIRCRKLALSVTEIPVHLTYDDNESTVKQLRYFFTLVPELFRIKSLELRGAYSTPSRSRSPDRGPRESELGPPPETTVELERAAHT
jgi:glycosyltransferase involved in cell wall biosynthesis